MPAPSSDSSRPGGIQIRHDTEPAHDQHHARQALSAHLFGLGIPAAIPAEFLSCVTSYAATHAHFVRHLTEPSAEMRAKWQAYADILAESRQQPFSMNRRLLMYGFIVSNQTLQRPDELPTAVHREFLEHIRWDMLDEAAIVDGCRETVPRQLFDSPADPLGEADFWNRRYRLTWSRNPHRLLLTGIADALYFEMLPAPIRERLPPKLKDFVDKHVEQLRMLAARTTPADAGTPARSGAGLGFDWPSGLRPGVAVTDWVNRWIQADASSEEYLPDACGELAPQDLFDRWRQATQLLVSQGHDPFPGIERSHGLLRDLMLLTLRVGQRHPDWEAWFAATTAASPYYLGHERAGNPQAAEAAKGFIASLWGAEPVFTTPLAVWVRRKWVLRWLSWAGGTADTAEARKGRITVAATWLREQWPTATGPHDEIDEARRYWAELKRQARADGEPIPVLLPDSMHMTAERAAGMALDLILLVRGPAAALKAVQLVLRDLQVPAVPHSLATTYARISQVPDERIASDWAMIPDLGMYVINRARALGEAAGWQLAQDFADDLVDRLKPRKTGVAEGDPAQFSGPGCIHPTMVEPSDLWRAGYVRALGELALDDTRKVSRVLDHVQRDDPSPVVAAGAGEARSLITERSTKRRGLSPWRLMIHAWWRLRWTHRLWLRLDVDPDAAQSVRLLEVRSVDRT